MGLRLPSFLKWDKAKKGWFFVTTAVIGVVAVTILAVVLLEQRPGVRSAEALSADLKPHEKKAQGLTLHIERLEWLDNQMDHNAEFPMPASMTPDLPKGGDHRLNVELALFNSGASPKTFRSRDLFLSSSEGPPRSARPSMQPEITLFTGQTAYLPVQFDVPGDEKGHLSLLWKHDGVEEKVTSVPHPPNHHMGEMKPKNHWPTKVADLPSGNPENGRHLYQYCVDCHGDPAMLGTNRFAPHLGAIKVANRVSEPSPAAYIYESILHPNAYIAPNCPNGPCRTPSAMPSFGKSMSQQDMADVIAYLLEST
jgi:hypothetical protein